MSTDSKLKYFLGIDTFAPTVAVTAEKDPVNYIGPFV